MKKTVLLLALSFVLVAFLTAQNDCTGNSYNDAYKAKKEKSVNYNDANNTSSWDCSKPGKTDDFYMSDRFIGLTAYKPATKPVEHWGHVVPNAELKSGNITFSPAPGEVFSASGPKSCCSPPADWSRYNSVRDN